MYPFSLFHLDFMGYAPHAGTEDRATLGSDPSAAPVPDDLPGMKARLFFDRLDSCAKSRGFGGRAPKLFAAS